MTKNNIHPLSSSDVIRHSRDAGEDSHNVENPIIGRILSHSIPMFCAENEEVVLKGTESRAFYFLKNGSLEISYQTGKTKIVVAMIGSGSFFGEIGYFDRISRVRDIRAVSDSEILVFEHLTMKKIQEETPLLYAEFMNFMARNICRKFRRILEDREPLKAYAASLSSGGQNFVESKPLPDYIYHSPDWKKINSIVEEFKRRIFNLSYNLQEGSGSEISEELVDEALDTMNRFNDRVQNFNHRHLDTKHADLIWGYVFKEIYPWLMRSRFAERSYFKPNGYAGDYMTMEMIYRNQPDGDGKLGRLLDKWCLQSVAVKAVRGRRKLLSEKIMRLCRNKLENEEPIHIMNLACGPNRELFDFIKNCGRSELIDALCVDIDPEALQYTDRHVNTFEHDATIRLMNENLVKWAIGRVKHKLEPKDVIYSSGLTDYLNDRLFLSLVNRCHEHLKPGGSLIIGNFSEKNPNRTIMDHVLHWRLIYREKDDLVRLFQQSNFEGKIEVTAESLGVNLFVSATKKT